MLYLGTMTPLRGIDRMITYGVAAAGLAAPAEAPAGPQRDLPPPRAVPIVQVVPAPVHLPTAHPLLKDVADGKATLRTGSAAKGSVALVQTALDDLADKDPRFEKARVNAGPHLGSFGPRTKTAVQAFQSQAGLTATGAVDSTTLGALEDALRSAHNLEPRPVTTSLIELPKNKDGDRWIDGTPAKEVKVSSARNGQRVLSYRANMAVDADGDTPNVYRSLSDYRAAQARGDKGIFQDPHKQSKTSLVWLEDGKRAYPNADKVPYIVVAPDLMPKSGARPGDLARVDYNGQQLYAVVADVGPGRKLGEASMDVARTLGIDPNPKNGGLDEDFQDVKYTVLTGSRHSYDFRTPRNHAELQTLGARLFKGAQTAGLPVN